jgi:hypothetical protein
MHMDCGPEGGILCDEMNAHQLEITLVRRTKAYVFNHSLQFYLSVIPLLYEDLLELCRPDLLRMFDFKDILCGTSLVLLGTIAAV